ncbi:MAG: hypothetical protein K0S71_552 [Clostridia bacterium]|jgi:hypothetical protein|nr:hypothetical protein [Clostridia bacterium]
MLKKGLFILYFIEQLKKISTLMQLNVDFLFFKLYNQKIKYSLNIN